MLMLLKIFDYYHENPKYWDTLKNYSNDPKNILQNDEVCRPRSDDYFGAVWPGSKQFTETGLSKNLRP